jgi:hypothetical protein
MRCFIPDIRYGRDLPAQTQLEDKVGGLPWGLPIQQWPICSCCESPQALVAQLVHHSERFDLGRDGRVLFIFKCNSFQISCPTHEPNSEAQTSFILDPEELLTGLTCPPSEVRAEEEIRVIDWLIEDDGVPEQYSAASYQASRQNLPEEIQEKLHEYEMKLGGIPDWENLHYLPDGDWRFLGQLSSCYRFFSPPVGEEYLFEKYGFCAFDDGPYMGRDGIGYIFMNDQNPIPTVLFYVYS